MTLKLKLLLGFCAVLFLTVAVGIWGVRGMDSMETVNAQADNIILGATHLQTAQSEQLRYFLYSTDKSVATVREALAAGRKAFADVQAMLPGTDPARAELSSLVAQVDTILKSFNDLLAHTAALAKVDDDYTVQGRKVLASTNELIELGYQRQNESLNQESAALVLQLTNARAQFSTVRYNTWLLATNPTTENLNLVLSGIDTYIRMLKECGASMVQQKSKDVLTRILGELEGYRAFVNQSGKMTMDRQKMVQDNGRLADEAVQKAQAVSTAMNAAFSLVRQDLTVKLYAVTGLAILVGLALTLLITRNVQGQLGRDPGVLATLARRVTAGDYDIDDGRPRSGVYADFVGMVGSLRELMSKAQDESERARAATEEAREAARLAEAARVEAQNARREGMLAAAEKLETVVAIVSSASTELSSQIDLSERGADQQSARVAETATAMEQMNATVLEVAKNASNAADVSASTRMKAETGAEVVRQAVNGIREVREQSLRLKEDMGKLDENAQAISQIMNVISDIADQTNLLALNAAIEAARAGEAGRGFAVVADEVRKLAEKTMASTTDVARAIQGIQGSAQSSLAQMDRAVASIEQATTFSAQSGEVLGEIVSLADSTADQVRAIATAAEEQSASSEAISLSITQVRGISEETSRAMSEASRAVAELAEQSQVLSRLIDEMKRC